MRCILGGSRPQSFHAGLCCLCFKMGGPGVGLDDTGLCAEVIVCWGGHEGNRVCDAAACEGE